MSRSLTVLLIAALLVSAVVLVQQIAPALAYAQRWDAGQPGNTFSEWSGLEPTDADWITDCQQRLLQLTR